MHTELCRSLIRKFMDTILTHKLQSIEIAVDLLDTVFQNDLLNDKDFSDYIGKSISRLYSQHPIKMDKYMKEYKKLFEQNGRKMEYSDDLKLTISHKMRTLHFFKKYLYKYNEDNDYIPSHFQQDILFVLNFVTQINDVLKLSDNELKEITDMIELFTMKDSIQRQKEMFKNRDQIVNCIEKYLYHIVKIPTKESELKKCREDLHVTIQDKWNKSDEELIKLIGFTTFEKQVQDMFNNENFTHDCLNSGAVMICRDFPCLEIGVSGTEKDFLDKLKVKYPDIDEFLPYMKIKPGCIITGFGLD